MKRNTILSLIILICLDSTFIFSQEDLQLTSKDSIVQSSWMIGVGYNFVDDSGDAFKHLTAFKTQWNTVAYPSRLSVGRYFKSGLGVEAIGTYNKYKKGKLVEGVINDSDKNYYAIDSRLSYDLNKIIGQTGWFDPYVGAGFGYTDSNNNPGATYNAVVGFRVWFSDRLGLDLNSSGKWRTSNEGTNHVQHGASVVYQFGIQKELSKKGEQKLALIEALEKEKQRVNDSIVAVDATKEAEALALRLEQEKENSRLAAIEQEKVDQENARKSQIDKAINNLGYVHFDLNSSVIRKDAKQLLNQLLDILIVNPTVKLKVTSHTDSRGQSKYNKWLSERRVNKTVKYLISIGVSTDRLLSEAYGEENLLNECDDKTYCPEEKHQLNRRSEFLIMEY